LVEIERLAGKVARVIDGSPPDRVPYRQIGADEEITLGQAAFPKGILGSILIKFTT
jgi:hypothetical protein